MGDDKKSKGLFTNMCKALGKGPIPEPYREKKSYGDDDMSDNDEPLPSSDQTDGMGENPPANTDGDEKPKDSMHGDEPEGESKVDGDNKTDDIHPVDKPEGVHKKESENIVA